MAFSMLKRRIDEKSLVRYIKPMPSFSSEIGGSYNDITIKEVGDANQNFVSIVDDSFVIKQALAYVGLFPDHQQAGELLEIGEVISSVCNFR